MVRKFKKLIGVVLILSILAFAAKALLGKNPIDDDYKSQYIAVLDRESGEIIYEKNGDTKASPASLTKIMTVYLSIENIRDFEEIAPIDIPTYKKMVEANASMAGFYGKEPVTYEDLLYGTMLASGGETANSLAVNLFGEVEGFVARMNERAGDLELKNTHFVNPEGLDSPDQYTSAKDLAKLLDKALDTPYFRKVFTSENHISRPTLDHPDGVFIESTVLSKVGETKGYKILGGKSGTTQKAGECWASLGEKDGKEYIVIVMGAPIDEAKFQIQDTKKIYENIR